MRLLGLSCRKRILKAINERSHFRVQLDSATKAQPKCDLVKHCLKNCRLESRLALIARAGVFSVPDFARDFPHFTPSAVAMTVTVGFGALR